MGPNYTLTHTHTSASTLTVSWSVAQAPDTMLHYSWTQCSTGRAQSSHTWYTSNAVHGKHELLIDRLCKARQLGEEGQLFRRLLDAQINAKKVWTKHVGKSLGRTAWLHSWELGEDKWECNDHSAADLKGMCLFSHQLVAFSSQQMSQDWGHRSCNMLNMLTCKLGHSANRSERYNQKKKNWAQEKCIQFKVLNNDNVWWKDSKN